MRRRLVRLGRLRMGSLRRLMRRWMRFFAGRRLVGACCLRRVGRGLCCACFGAGVGVWSGMVRLVMARGVCFLLPGFLVGGVCCLVDGVCLVSGENIMG